jgi:hypothetical protein
VRRVHAACSSPGSRGLLIAGIVVAALVAAGVAGVVLRRRRHVQIQE